MPGMLVCQPCMRDVPTDILVRLLLVPEARRLGLDIEDIDREVAVSKRYARASPEDEAS